MGKIRFNITKDGLSFSKGKGKLSVPIDREVKYWDKEKKEWVINKSRLFFYRTIFVPFFYRNPFPILEGFFRLFLSIIIP